LTATATRSACADGPHRREAADGGQPPGRRRVGVLLLAPLLGGRDQQQDADDQQQRGDYEPLAVLGTRRHGGAEDEAEDGALRQARRDIAAHEGEGLGRPTPASQHQQHRDGIERRRRGAHDEGQ
jgi:hypothetical protein